MSCSPSRRWRARPRRRARASPIIWRIWWSTASFTSWVTTTGTLPRRCAWKAARSPSWPRSGYPILISSGRPAMADSASRPRRGGLLAWLRQLGGGPDEEPSLRDELEELIEEHDEQQPIDPLERTLLVNILKLHEVTASVMMSMRGTMMSPAVTSCSLRMLTSRIRSSGSIGCCSSCSSMSSSSSSRRLGSSSGPPPSCRSHARRPPRRGREAESAMAGLPDEIRIGYPERGQDGDLAAFHAHRLGSVPVVVTQEVKDAVDHQMRQMIGEALALRRGLARHRLEGEHDIAQQNHRRRPQCRPRPWHGAGGGERQDVGRLVLVAEAPVEIAQHGIVRQHQR